MTASLYLVGAPGVGKSTLMASLLAGYEQGPSFSVPGYAPLVVEPLIPDALYLGRHRPDFPGTDALSMSVLPAATAWAAGGTLPGLVVGEGARLANLGFLSALASRGPLVLLYLAASESALLARRAGRGSSQASSWARGQLTRTRNLVAAAQDSGIHVETVWAASPAADVAVRARRAVAACGLPLL